MSGPERSPASSSAVFTRISVIGLFASEPGPQDLN